MKISNNIIINADDFGYKTSVNRAIILSFEKGYINSTTIMANMPAFEEAIDLAHQHNIINKIGVHLVLTEGEPLTDDIREIDYLFHQGLSLDMRLKKLFFLNKNAKQLIFEEYSAQIERVLKKGIKISHIDTHHQIHDLYGIMQILISLLKKYNIPSMRILNNLESSNNYLKTIYRGYMNNYIFKRKINFSNFLGNQFDYISTINKKSHFIHDKIVEIMVHPDLDKDGSIKDIVGTKICEIDFLKKYQLHS